MGCCGLGWFDLSFVLGWVGSGGKGASGGGPEGEDIVSSVGAWRSGAA